MAQTSSWIRAVRASHDQLTALVQPLDPGQATARSYAGDWSIADVASHLGSQAEIFEMFLTAGMEHTPVPGSEEFGPIWDRWNALAPTDQIRRSVAANETFVRRLEATTDQEREAYSASIFGAEQDLSGLCATRLGEHALHTWDIAVALHPGATLLQDAVDLLIDTVGSTAARTGKSEPTSARSRSTPSSRIASSSSR